MGGGHENFMPVDAIDGAAFRGGAAATLLVRATKDADNRVHVLSASHMSAAESDLSVGAHIQAEKRLYSLAEKPRVSIMDGGVSLVKQTQTQLRNTQVMRCSRHLMQDLLSKGKGPRKRTRESGGDDQDAKEEEKEERELDVFKRIRYLSRAAAPYVRSRLEMLQPGCALRRIPADELCPSLLPHGCWTHGVTTNNFAEVANMMLLPLRRERSMFRSMLRFEKFCLQRHMLHGERLRKVKAAGQKDESNWKEGVVVPAVEEAEGSLLAQAMLLNEPRRTRRDGREVDIVESRSGGLLKKAGAASGSTKVGSGFAHHVSMESLLDGDFDKVCDCGMTGCRPIMCSHARRVIAHSRKDWRLYLKPWLTVRAWERQVGPAWESFTARDIIQQTEMLRQKGKLLRLHSSTIDVGMRGRPMKGSDKSSEERAKSFMEELSASKDLTDEAIRMFAAGHKLFLA